MSSDPTSTSSSAGTKYPGWPRTIVIQQPGSSRWLTWVLVVLLLMSVLLNIVLTASVASRSASANGPMETHVSGTVGAGKLAIIEFSGTIMPPLTERWLKTIETIQQDSSIDGVLLRIDSPGGLVADSHQIYHALNELREAVDMPVYVSMARIAASGGYYIAMGAGQEGKIFAEPTTWTGSIGVMIPHYDVSGLGEQLGIDSSPLTTGPYKDSLNPFKELSDGEKEVWEAIMTDAFDQFKGVIKAGRAGLDEAAIAELATGQVYTAKQSLANGLIDEIGFEDDALAALAEKVGLDDPQIVKFEYPPTLTELLLGRFQQPAVSNPWQLLLEAGVPKAMYLCGWNAGVSYPVVH
jgi:protease-4